MGKYTSLTISILLLGLFSCSKTYLVSETFEDGSVESYELNKKDSLRNGAYNFTYPNGQTQATGNYINDLEDGVFLRYYENGQIEEKVTYQNGNFDGLYEYYYENGTLKQSAHYINNKIEGQLVNYYENGTKKEEVTLLGGTEEGPFKEYYSNGKLKTEGKYTTIREDAVETDTLIEYDSLGNLSRKALCEISEIGSYKVSTCKTLWTRDSI